MSLKYEVVCGKRAFATAQNKAHTFKHASLFSICKYQKHLQNVPVLYGREYDKSFMW